MADDGKYLPGAPVSGRYGGAPDAARPAPPVTHRKHRFAPPQNQPALRLRLEPGERVVRF